jgi:NAD(P)H-hydrate epimerase
LTRTGDSILLLAGKGHNGDDVRAAQMNLPERRVELFEVTDPAAALPILEKWLLARPDLIIDGLFGIGVNRPLGPEWVQFIERLNAARLPILAVDVPSGLNADTGQPQGAAVQARVTITVGAPKQGMLLETAWPFVGRLEVASNVGLVPCPVTTELQWTLPEDFADYPPPRAPWTHKGSYGHLAIVAGSLGYHGAAVLAARGAQRAQPGLITLRTLEPAYHAIAAQLQAVMVRPWVPDMKMPGPWTAVLVGPGLASEDVPDPTKMFTRYLWRDSLVPVVVDASALDWLRVEPVPKPAIRVMTPHPGEAARLLRTTAQQIQANRVAALRDISRRFGHAWVVLKGHQTLVGRSSGEVFVNCSGNPHMAQGGSGDLLAGFLAGFLAQPELATDLLKVVRYAVWEHGAAADQLQARLSNWVVEDLVEELGQAGERSRASF